MTKQKIKIKNRYNSEIIVEGEYEDLKQAVIERKDNLRGANLREANLQEANLREANFWGANLRGAKIKVTQKEELITCLGIKLIKD